MMVRHIGQLAGERIKIALEGRRGIEAVRAVLIESTAHRQGPRR